MFVWPHDYWLKGIVYLKMKIQYTHPHVIQNLCDIISAVEDKIGNCEDCTFLIQWELMHGDQRGKS